MENILVEYISNSSLWFGNILQRPEKKMRIDRLPWKIEVENRNSALSNSRGENFFQGKRNFANLEINNYKNNDSYCN